MQTPLATIQVYADYGTFLLTSFGKHPEFPVNVNDEDIRLGCRILPDGLRLSVSSGGIDAWGLMEEAHDQAVAKIINGEYSVEGRAYFMPDKNVFRLALRS